MKTILNKYHSHLQDDLSRRITEDRTVLLSSYQNSLDKLSAKLVEFEGKTAESFSELTNNNTAAWHEIYEQLNNLIFLIRHTIKCYKDEISIWLKLSRIISMPIDKREQPKLTHAQIAILFNYNGHAITENNATDIAKKYGQTSGKRLVMIYKDLAHTLVRTGKGKYRVRDIEAVLPLLTNSAKNQAEKELVIAIANNGKK